MADQPLLEVNCANCPGTHGCEDCLVHFFLTGRDTVVVPLVRRAAGRRDASVATPATTGASVPAPSGMEPADDPSAGLPADLAAALASLDVAGLAPELLSLESNDAARAS
jgi:hypothetical protein